MGINGSRMTSKPSESIANAMMSELLLFERGFTPSDRWMSWGTVSLQLMHTRVRAAPNQELLTLMLKLEPAVFLGELHL